MKKLLAQYGLEGITYKNGVPDFSAFSYGTVEIFNMHGGTNGRDINFSRAYKELSLQSGLSVKELKAIGMSVIIWLRCNLSQLIPTEINAYFGHLGGIAEINLFFSFFGY